MIKFKDLLAVIYNDVIACIDYQRYRLNCYIMCKCIKIYTKKEYDNKELILKYK